jgi:hypothetical protein
MNALRTRHQIQNVLKQLGGLRRKTAHMKALADYGFGPVDIETGSALCLRALRACDAIDDLQRWCEHFGTVRCASGILPAQKVNARTPRCATSGNSKNHVAKSEGT